MSRQCLETKHWYYRNKTLWSEVISYNSMLYSFYKPVILLIYVEWRGVLFLTRSRLLLLSWNIRRTNDFQVIPNKTLADALAARRLTFISAPSIKGKAWVKNDI